MPIDLSDFGTYPPIVSPTIEPMPSYPRSLELQGRDTFNACIPKLGIYKGVNRQIYCKKYPDLHLFGKCFLFDEFVNYRHAILWYELGFATHAIFPQNAFPFPHSKKKPSENKSIVAMNQLTPSWQGKVIKSPQMIVSENEYIENFPFNDSLPIMPLHEDFVARANNPNLKAHLLLSRADSFWYAGCHWKYDSSFVGRATFYNPYSWTWDGLFGISLKNNEHFLQHQFTLLDCHPSLIRECGCMCLYDVSKFRLTNLEFEKK